MARKTIRVTVDGGVTLTHIEEGGVMTVTGMHLTKCVGCGSLLGQDDLDDDYCGFCRDAQARHQEAV